MLVQNHYADCLEEMIEEWHTINTELTLQEYLCLDDMDFKEYINSGRIDTKSIIGTIQETLQKIDFRHLESVLKDLNYVEIGVVELKKLLSVCDMELNWKHSEKNPNRDRGVYEGISTKYSKCLNEIDVDFPIQAIKVKLPDMQFLLGIIFEGGI